MRELSRITGFSTPCLTREAKALAEESIVIIEKRANRSYCRANEKSPVYHALAELVAKTASGESILRDVFADSDSPIVFIYGSRANGKARPDSDYDVFVIGNEGLRKVSARINEAAGRIGVEVNPYVITADELRKRMKAGDHFLTEVMGSKKVFLKGGNDELGAMAG